MSKQKESKKPVIIVGVIAVVLLILFAACLAVPGFVNQQKKQLVAGYEKEMAAWEEEVAERTQAHNAEVSRLEAAASEGRSQDWPAHSAEGWDIVDLTGYALENRYTESVSRQDVMNNGMLLVNQWHSRPDDFQEAAITGVGNYANWKIPVSNASVSLFPVAIDALQEALTDATAAGMENYIVSEGYRSWDTQNASFQARKEKLASKYTDEAALIEATKKYVNYPGTSEFNSGLSFTLRLYKAGDAEISKPDYTTTPQGQWMSENCWKYGIVFRFPLPDFPMKGTMGKAHVTGVSTELNLYRYVGKAHATVMHLNDLCLEEYIEYLQQHPHIALFEDGTLKYEIYRQYVGDDSESFTLELTGNAVKAVSSMDNMGYVITAFEY